MLFGRLFWFDKAWSIGENSNNDNNSNVEQIDLLLCIRCVNLSHSFDMNVKANACY